MESKKLYRWELQDVILISMICIVFGVVYLVAVYAATFLGTLFAPFGLTPLGNELVFGIWFMAATLAPYIIQKPGVAIIAEILAALIEVLLGNWFGPMVIVSGLIQGAGAEAVFAFYKYERFDRNVMVQAAIGCCITGFLWSFVRSGYLLFSVPLILFFFVVRVLSSVLFAGLLSQNIGDSLVRTGLMKGYALGRSDD
ncbi:MAG: ECF transporter S component [Tissierellia bacterium]|nr:ECF transporter S component [Tissierellia bacterium]